MSAMSSLASTSLISRKVAFDFTTYLLSLELRWRDSVMNNMRPINGIDWRHPAGTKLASLLAVKWAILWFPSLTNHPHSKENIHRGDPLLQLDCC
jgi:hypothetical protein